MKEDEIISRAVKVAKEQNFKGTYFAVVDFSRLAKDYRFFVVNVKKQEIDTRTYTTHGRASGPLRQAIAFSNIPNSNRSSLGLMKCSEVYYGKHGKSLRLDGLEPGKNDNVRKRAIVIHPAEYTSPEYVADNGTPGRSLGCFTLPPDIASKVIDKLKNGSLLLAVNN